MSVHPRILIVEDEINNHPLFQEAFEAAGFEVLLCEHADGDFLETVANFKPTIISMDLMIGKTGHADSRDGFQAIELLKTDERTKKIPVIVVTNFFQDTKISFARALGAQDYLNLQGLTLPKIAAKFKQYVDAPKKYQPTNSAFRTE